MHSIDRVLNRHLDDTFNNLDNAEPKTKRVPTSSLT